jgi:LacI family transcriptional regulator
VAKRRKVLVIHPVGDPQQMPTLRGICEYARQRGSWVVQSNPEVYRVRLQDLTRWSGDGIIALLRSRADVQAARASGRPVVNLSCALRETGLPRVTVDQQGMGRLAAEHLLGCGLRRFAYYGERDMWYSQERKRGFIARLAEEGRPCSVLETTTALSGRNPWYRWTDAIEAWLGTLQPPVGLLAVHDYAASVVIEACRAVRLSVPEDVAVVGVGDDWITCEFCEVPVTSIARNNREVGYRAAALLDRLMAGRRAPKSDILVPPEGVVKRRSTEMLAIDDPKVAAAVRFVNDHLSEPFGVATLSQHVSLSRRALDLHFRKSLGCTPRDYICRARIEGAKRLLVSKKRLKLPQIARACGFRSARRLGDTFRRTTGSTTTGYRQVSEEARLERL